MPNINELAEVMVNGERFTDWETVSVETSFHEAARFAQFTVSENAKQNVTLATLQIKPGDRAEVYLAGIKVVTGVVFARQSAIDANSHQVLISVRDDSGEIVHGTQDNSSGTRTTITMTRPEARNGPIGKVTEPAGSGNELPGGTLQPAEPVDG